MLALVVDGCSAAASAISVFRFCSESMQFAASMHSALVFDHCAAAMHASLVFAHCTAIHASLVLYEFILTLSSNACKFVYVCVRVRLAFVTAASV